MISLYFAVEACSVARAVTILSKTFFEKIAISD
jgi:hypothetical protein